MSDIVYFNQLIGKTLVGVVQGTYSDNEALVFGTSEGKLFLMTHVQDCCESVDIESIVGDLNDLVGTPIIMAEEVSNDVAETGWGDEQWTFYKFATIKGYVDIRWHGVSNGYYSTSVNFSETTPQEIQKYFKTTEIITESFKLALLPNIMLEK